MTDIGISNNSATANVGDNTSHIANAERAEVNLFFDGTGNNFYNVTANEKLKGEESYANGLSNIARLWSSINLANDVIALYIEGIGTTQQQRDSVTGMALGLGETGVAERVDSAFPLLPRLVAQKRGERGLPAIVDINVFGFSRGAAAARRFVYLASAEKHRFGQDWAKVIVRCNFVGLFDTVASYGLNHDNDVSDLHLNFAPNTALKVFHLIAGDEYRHNFPVTTIASALALHVQNEEGNQCMGYELQIPGSHSDVGGGYQPNEIERRTLPPNVRDFVYEQGWYSAQDQSSSFLGIHQRQVSGEYHMVGLALMVDQAHLHTTTHFPQEMLDQISDPQIRALQIGLRDFAKDERNTVWDLSKRLEVAQAQSTRHRHLHQSFTSSGAMIVRLVDSIPQRKYLQG